MTTQKFAFQTTDIKGAYIVTPFCYDDRRGYFAKNFEKKAYLDVGFNREIAEEFETYSVHNVIRGLHFQSRYPQDKIVRCVSGSIYDVIVDLRRDSETFGQWRGFSLTSDNRQSLMIPRGCAHGFLVKSQGALVSYICAGTYLIEYDTGILWEDPTLRIKWPIDEKCDVVVSLKDKNLQTYDQFVRRHGGFSDIEVG